MNDASNPYASPSTDSTSGPSPPQKTDPALMWVRFLLALGFAYFLSFVIVPILMAASANGQWGPRIVGLLGIAILFSAISLLWWALKSNQSRTWVWILSLTPICVLSMPLFLSSLLKILEGH